jgi:alpha-tubulin suppressor-like RCC1 family protein
MKLIIKLQANFLLTVVCLLAGLFVNKANAGPHDYFEGLKAKPQHYRSWALRDQTQLNSLVSSSPSKFFTYQPGGDLYGTPQDGAKLLKPPRKDFYKYPQFAAYGSSGDENIAGNNTLRMPVAITSGKFLLTWDFWWGNEFQDNRGTVDAFKTFFLYSGSGPQTGGTTLYWLWHDVLGSDRTTTLAPGELSKQHSSLGNSPLAPGVLARDPYNPTGLGALPYRTFRTKLATWTRYWLEVRMDVPGSEFTEWSQTYLGGVPLTGTWDMVSLWAADENRNPVRIHYRVPAPRTEPMFTTFRFSFDTSSHNLTPGTGLDGPLIGYGRNVAILRNYDLNESDTSVFARPIGGGIASADLTPPTVSVSSPSNGAAVSGTVTLTANASDNIAVAGVRFKVDGVNVGVEDLTAPYSVSWISTAGSHAITAVARDAAGNSTTSSTVNVTVSSSDTTKPTVAITAPAAGSTVSGTATISANASDNIGVVGVQFKVDGVNVGLEDLTAPYSTAWNTATATSGSHAITAVARDAAGNSSASSTVSVTVGTAVADTTKPTISMTSPVSGSTVSGTTAISASASDNMGVVGVQFKVDGVNLGAEDTVAPYSISWNTTTVANGAHTVTATARDAAGNSAVLTIGVTVSNVASDTTAPTVSVTSPVAGATVSDSVTISANASDNVGVVGVQFKVGGVNVGAEDTVAPYSISWNTTSVVNGSRTITAVARDAAGNTKTSSSITVTVFNDTTDPTVSINSPAAGDTVSDSVTITANASDNVGVLWVKFRVDGVNLGALDYTAPYSAVWDTTTYANGPHTLLTQVMDAAGNSSWSSSVVVTVNNQILGALSGGEGHSVVVKNDGTVWTWGLNSTGQLGIGSTADSATPVQIPGMSAVEVSAGDAFTAMLKADGTIWTCGKNTYGQLGTGNTFQKNSPVMVSGLSEIIAMDAGSQHTVAVKSDGTVWSWGYGLYGQMGNTTTNKYNLVPVQASGLTGVSAVAAGYNHTVALKSDGTVWAWGQNGEGQLGNGTTSKALTPVQVPGLSDVIQIAAGSSHTMALKSDGTVWTWGNGASGRLGTGGTVSKLSPVQAVISVSINQIAANGSHSLAIASDGTVWSWGHNSYGQLGDGSFSHGLTPGAINLGSAISIGAGEVHSIALKADGTVWTFGRNVDSQLGNGTTTNSATPIQVNGLDLIAP